MFRWLRSKNLWPNRDRVCNSCSPRHYQRLTRDKNVRRTGDFALNRRFAMKNYAVINRTPSKQLIIGSLCSLMLLAVLSVTAFAQMGGAGSNPEMQQKLMALKQSAAENKQ